MPKYIDAKLLEKYFKREEWGTPDERWRPESEFGAFVDAIPTADVQKVVHGKWIWGIEEHPYALSRKITKRNRCSLCGKSGFNKFLEYCPYCGAKMDGKEK